MTDRGSSALQQSKHSLTVGPSSMIWDEAEQSLIISINEVSSLPIISHVKGTIIVKPKSVTDVELPLTSKGTHIWRPFAPTAEIEVDLNKADGNGQDMAILMQILELAHLSKTLTTGRGVGFPFQAEQMLLRSRI